MGDVVSTSIATLATTMASRRSVLRQCEEVLFLQSAGRSFREAGVLTGLPSSLGFIQALEVALGGAIGIFDMSNFPPGSPLMWPPSSFLTNDMLTWPGNCRPGGG